MKIQQIVAQRYSFHEFIQTLEDTMATQLSSSIAKMPEENFHGY